MGKPKRRKARIKLVPFSQKQRQLLNWWAPDSPVKDASGIICDGSIRAGKTFPGAISFVEWAFANFDGQQFAFCGKSIGSLRRNITNWLIHFLRVCGYHVVERRQDKEIIVSKGSRTNTFFLFGGKDESSASLIQGVTLAGVFFDEVAVQPQSFVNQATGRCSVTGSKIWFNCNPDNPSHWFKTEWIDKAQEKNYLHLHFTMQDNPSLDTSVRRRLENDYHGVFYQRMILGLWVAAEGAIYSMFGPKNVYKTPDMPLRFRDGSVRTNQYIAIDYGTQNATTFLWIIDTGHIVYVHEEYYHSGRTSGQKTDSQYADDLDAFCKGKNICGVIIDPSAASFRAELRNRGYNLKEADNEVLDGIRMTGALFGNGILKVNARCVNLIRELQSYVWNPKPTDKGKEEPLKRDDHGPDALRYWVKTIFRMVRLQYL